MEVLIVKRPFGDYARGDLISDQAEIKRIEDEAVEGRTSRRIDFHQRHDLAEPEHDAAPDLDPAANEASAAHAGPEEH